MAKIHYNNDIWSRRTSTESVLTIQEQETDFVHDTTDIDSLSDDRDVEYEPVTDEEERAPVSESSGESDNEIITTKVIEVSARDDGEELADSEWTNSGGSDSEIDLHDYWHCAQCRARNNNPLYRYCERCFKVRKNFFPPRPQRKQKRTLLEPKSVPPILSQDSGIESQGFSQDLAPSTSTNPTGFTGRPPKRRSDSADRNNKRIKLDYSESDSDSDTEKCDVKLLVKTVSDPSLTIEGNVNLTKKAISHSLKEIENDNLCIMCLNEPKSGVFVHGRIAHICCCYKCAVKVWAKAKRCPICNCKVSNVLKAVVM